MKLKICIMINTSIGLYTFRKEFLEELIKEGYEVYVLALPSEKKKDIENIGCKFIDVNVDRKKSVCIYQLLGCTQCKDYFKVEID